jgi:hypothetical protein
MARYIQIDGQLVDITAGPRLPGLTHAILHHGDNPDVERPVDIDIVTWVGDVEPNNWIDDDIWEAIGVVENVETEYILKDGSRAFTGAVSGVDPTEPAHLTTQSFVEEYVALSGTGATGGVKSDGTLNAAFVETETVISEDYEITEGHHAITAGPLTIEDDVEITIPSGSVWIIV